MLSALGVSGCHAPARSSPEVVYQGIYADLLHGNLEVARAKAEQARQEFFAQHSGSDATWELLFRLLEADILLRQSRPQQAMALLAESVQFPANGDLAIRRHWLRGLAYSRLGQSTESDSELHEARRLGESSHSPLMGQVLRAEGMIRRNAGDWEGALQRLRASLAMARVSGDQLLQAGDLVDLGYVSLQSGRYDQAVLLSQEAANFAVSVQAGRQIPMALGNLGWAYESLGDSESALSNFQAAERYAKDAGMTNLQVFWLEDAGLAEYRLGNLAQAEKYDEAALRLALQLPAAGEVDDIVNIETNLALLLYEQGANDAARRYSDQAVLASRQSKDDKVIAYALYLQGLIAARQANQPEAERLLMQAHQLTTDGETRMEIENALAILYLAGRQPRQAELWYRTSIQTFEHNRSSVQIEALRLSSFAHGDTVYRDYAEFLIKARRPNEALLLLDRSRARTLEEGLGFTKDASKVPGDVLDPRAVSRRLHAPLLFYALGPEKSYLWAVTAGGVHLYMLPKQAEIQSLIEDYQRDILKSADPLQSQSTAATMLYEALVAPAAALIPEGSRVYVIPDGALHALNYETLIKATAAGRHYWIEEVTVTVTSSLRMLSRWPANSADAAAPRDLLLIGNPVAAGRDFEALPNAATEMDRVQRHFAAPGVTVIAQARATPASYAASGPEHFTYIHFVAHGTASRSSPLDSAVVLSPAPSSPDDFKLYAREIVQHPLHARLVTVSACYGSGVRSYAGEGLVGLAWAFLRAGSHHVISALWEVNDSATPLMMDRLYDEIQAGKAPDVALRSAKLSLIHSPNVYRKPFYWGAFQLYAGA